MSRIAYVNGRYVPHGEAQVHVEDRGYQFADGVYEVIAVEDGRLIDEPLHLARLDRSLRELRIDWPMPARALSLVMREVARRNRVRNGIVYLQVTRGVARRDHKFPKVALPALVITARSQTASGLKLFDDGVKVITIPDIRWKRCDIKSVSLLPNVLGKQQAAEAGAYEAWQVDSSGYVTEGTSSNAWIITKDGAVVTRDVSDAILNGITRISLLAVAREQGLAIEERPFTVAEAKQAREAFVTSTTSFVLPVTQIDDTVIGNGKPGSFAARLRDHYADYMAGPGAAPERVASAAE
jgi:D-alanine transaminase